MMSLMREKKKGAIEMAAAALATASTVSLPLKKATEQSAAEAATSTAAKEETENQPQKQPQWPVPDSYIVDPDAGIITCICDLNDDDGFTIQCDHCNRWQHAICYGIKDIGMAPDDYLCNSCDPREVDINLARKIQQERINVKTVEPSSSNNSASNKNNGRDRASSTTISDVGDSFSTDQDNTNHRDKRRKRNPSNNSIDSKTKALLSILPMD